MFCPWIDHPESPIVERNEYESGVKSCRASSYRPEMEQTWDAPH